MSGLKTTLELMELQKERDREFFEICSALAENYTEKNVQHRDAYRRINGSDVERGFEDIRRKVDILNLALKYKDVAFDPTKFREDAKDLATYSIMFVGLLMNVPSASLPKGAQPEME
jgi:hypothetical protein